MKNSIVRALVAMGMLSTMAAASAQADGYYYVQGKSNATSAFKLVGNEKMGSNSIFLISTRDGLSHYINYNETPALGRSGPIRRLDQTENLSQIGTILLICKQAPTRWGSTVYYETRDDANANCRIIYVSE